ncbi:PaaI family thioesterase [Paenibacillus alginolyticus]|uniref:PaaI family thioesterase n=1 Tax=Paenibacillus alginolyticus TaxID=59839 RepID=A0ABT4GL90_9BACL|nr:PaaI family thioesterase [Paenibacillus alginolyticus]MCY9696979.1 PaaI family thioesterase [Paenibacillus alginolyticus]MEC0147365.1 PaaI family thioesterase [Paenibacillus alginolyticus]
MDDANERINKRLQQLAASAEPTFWGYLGCEFVSMQDNIIAIALEAKTHHLNPIGIVHGGVLSSLLDNAMGIVVMMARPEDKVVTTNLNVHFVAPLYEGRLVVTAELVHQSRKMITTQGRVFDREGNLGTIGTGTFRVI